MGAHPQISGFFTWREFLPPIVTNPDVISYAHLFPSEGIEMISGFTSCISTRTHFYTQVYIALPFHEIHNNGNSNLRQHFSE
jgi:hypothetical protein